MSSRSIPLVTDLVGATIAAALEMTDRARTLVVGLCGAQGSGKSTVATALCRRLAESGLVAASLSLDDLYLTRAERRLLARDIHPLLATRGVPGTHDVALGGAVFAAIDAGQRLTLPRFDKARDDRAPALDWPEIQRPDVLIFEGWCVGARPQPAAALVDPVNSLERDEDAAAVWRTHVNTALAGAYQTLFARIDLLVMLAAPSFEIVGTWRREQERRLRATAPAGTGVMTDAELARFVAHYERLTRWLLAEMPARADLTIDLAPDRASLPGQFRFRR